MLLSTEMESLRVHVGEKRTIEILAKAGYDALDYTFTPGMEEGTVPWNGPDYAAYAKEVNKMAKDHGLIFNQAHAPFLFSKSAQDNYKEEVVPVIARCMECCALLGIPQAIIHPLHHLPYESNRQKLWDMNMEYYHALLPYAREFGVKIGLENMYCHDHRRGILNTDMFSQPQEFNAFFDELNDPNFICCLDTGHCTLTHQDPAEMILAMGGRITALHINDNLYRTDDHLVPGMGLIDWDSVLKALAQINYQGDMTFESLTSYKGFDESFFETAAKYAHDVGRYMVRKFKEYAANGGDKV